MSLTKRLLVFAAVVIVATLAVASFATTAGGGVFAPTANDLPLISSSATISPQTGYADVAVPVEAASPQASVTNSESATARVKGAKASVGTSSAPNSAARSSSAKSPGAPAAKPAKSTVSHASQTGKNASAANSAAHASDRESQKREVIVPKVRDEDSHGKGHDSGHGSNSDSAPHGN